MKFLETVLDEYIQQTKATAGKRAETTDIAQQALIITNQTTMAAADATLNGR